jgi:hypothetical protein
VLLAELEAEALGVERAVARTDEAIALATGWKLVVICLSLIFCAANSS